MFHAESSKCPRCDFLKQVLMQSSTLRYHNRDQVVLFAAGNDGDLGNSHTTGICLHIRAYALVEQLTHSLTNLRVASKFKKRCNRSPAETKRYLKLTHLLRQKNLNFAMSKTTLTLLSQNISWRQRNTKHLRVGGSAQLLLGPRIHAYACACVYTHAQILAHARPRWHALNRTQPLPMP